MNNHCTICNSYFNDRRNLLQHQREKHRADFLDTRCTTSKSGSTLQETDGTYSLHLMQNALRKFARSYQISSTDSSIDADSFLNGCYGLINILCGNILGEWNHGLKLLISLNIQFVRSTDDTESIVAHFNSPQRVILRGSDIDYELKAAFTDILLKIDKFTQKGSGWTVNNILHCDLHVTKYQALRGSTFKPLPAYLKLKKAIVNIRNEDQRCFMWSILAAVFPVAKNSDRPSSYADNIHKFDFDCINFPASLKDVKTFEKKNNLSINVFGYEEKSIYPLLISTNKSETEIDLLLYDNHYSTIRRLSALLQDQNKCKLKKYFCRRCLMHFYSENDLLIHREKCLNNEPARTTFPKDKTLKFKNFAKMQKVPYAVYADFECILEKIDCPLPSLDKSFTTKYQHHVPCGYGLVEVFDCGCPGAKAEIRKPHIYRGPDCIENFLNHICELSDTHLQNMLNGKTIKMLPQDWKQFNDANVCYICNDGFDSDSKRARDHCHFCGTFRGATHVKCNVNYSLRKDIPIFFHNLRKYDSHLIMQKLAIISKSRNLEIDCIPKGLEDYLCFSVSKPMIKSRKRKTEDDDIEDDKGEDKNYYAWKMKFVDSYQFLSSSLNVLVENLKTKGRDNFNAMNTNFNLDECNLLLRKGLYPYEFMDDFSKFKLDHLPTLEEFHSTLTNSDISIEDYAHCNNVWKKLKLSTMGDYHDVYLKTDVLLLCDVFENFRNFCLYNFQLDPAHYITLPSFGWDACLKMTNVELELLQDIDMYNFFEAGIRGGVSVISHRFAKANNPYVESFCEDIKRLYIMYLDANNLYGSSMVQKLPVNNFRWLSREEIDIKDWTIIDCSGNDGWVLEVDLDYPVELHESHNDYPLAPERLCVSDNMLSHYCSSTKAELGNIGGTVKKLIPNLMNKTKYIVHCKNLQLYLSLGLKLTQVHRVIQFNQEAWLSKYINFNTEMRKKATSAFEKDLFKLLNNAVFGKTMENVREFVDAKILSSEASFLKWTANPRFKQFSIFNNDLVAVMLQKATVCLCKPIYVGFTVLDFSKHLMYDFHYNYIVKKYGNNSKLLFTDTDSLCYAIHTNDIYQDMLCDSTYFDTSDYPDEHFLKSQVNKKVLGKMKDETNGAAIDEFVGLRSKMYSIKLGKEEKKRAKGVQKCVVKKTIRHEHYKEVLFAKTERRDLMKMIRNEKHEIYTVIQNKKSLSCYDDKRYLLQDGITSYAYGHFNI